MRTLAVSLAFVIGLAGCGTSSVDSNFSFDSSAPNGPNGADTGLLIGTVSSQADRDWIEFSSTFYYGDSDRSNSGRIQTGSIMGLVADLVTPDSELPDADGEIFAIELPPGEYSFRSWYITTGTVSILPSPRPEPIPFAITPGRATYVGNLNMRGVVRRNFFGIPLLFGGEATITDRSARDLPLLLEHYPNLRREDIDAQIPDDTAWRGLGASKDVYIP